MADQNADKADKPSDSSILDLGELPPLQLTVMRTIMRETQVGYERLRQLAENLPTPIRQVDLDRALKTLLEDGWLTQTDTQEFKATLRRKASRLLNDAQSDSLPRDIWDSVDARPKPDSE